MAGGPGTTGCRTLTTRREASNDAYGDRVRSFPMASEHQDVVTDEDVDEYRERGYVVVEGLYDGDVEDIVDTITNIVENPDDYPDSVFGNVVDESELPEGMADIPALDRVKSLRPKPVPEYRQYFDDETAPAARAAARLLGHQDLRRIYLFSFCNPPQLGDGAPWHQDQGLWSQWMPGSVTCWVALSEVTPENGCLRFVPGSHEDGVVPHVPAEESHPHLPDSVIDEDAVEYAVMEPGDAVLFDPLVYHRSSPNETTDQRRLSSAAVYTPDHEWEEAYRIAQWVQYRYDIGHGVGMTQSSPSVGDENWQDWPHVHVRD